MKQIDFHVWVPGLCQRGGIQTFSRLLIDAIHVQFSTKLAIFSKNDTSNELQNSFSRDFVYALGCWPSFVRTIVYIFSLFLLALIQRPNLIFITHVHFAPIAMLLKKITQQKYVVFVHGAEVWNLKKPWLKLSLEKADKVLSVSEFTRQKILNQGYPFPENIIVFPCTFDERVFRLPMEFNRIFLGKYGIQAQDQILLSVCRLEGSEIKKGYDLVLEALALLRKDFPCLKYVIVGDGNDRCRLENKIRVLNLSHAVILAGVVSDAELPIYYQNADIFVLPSEREGFGIVFLEAMACGLPVIGARCAGSTEALLDGELGELISPGDSKELSQKISEKLSGSRGENYRQGVRQKALEVFGFEKFCERLKKAVSMVLDEK